MLRLLNDDFPVFRGSIEAADPHHGLASSAVTSEDRYFLPLFRSFSSFLVPDKSAPSTRLPQPGVFNFPFDLNPRIHTITCNTYVQYPPKPRRHEPLPKSVFDPRQSVAPISNDLQPDPEPHMIL